MYEIRYYDAAFNQIAVEPLSNKKYAEEVAEGSRETNGAVRADLFFLGPYGTGGAQYLYRLF